MGVGDKRAVFRFADFTLDLVRGGLFGPDGAERPLRPKSFALLHHLVEHAGRLIDRNEIMEAVWPDVIVTDDSITQCMKEVRRALGDEAQQLLRTLPRRGYLLGAEVSRVDSAFVVAPVGAISSPAQADAPPRPPTGRPIVVVVPFDNIGGDAEQIYFVDGLTADLVTDLTRFQALHIVSPLRRGGWSGRTLPVTPWSGAEPASRPAGYLVSGSVRRTSGRIRVTAQLEDAENGVILWSGRFDRSLEDLFAVQEELAERIAAVLAAYVDHEALRRAKRRPPASLDAYDLCLRGRELHAQATEAATLAAREMFDRAIAADPDYAPAYALNAFTVQRAVTHGWGTPRGRAALDLALSLAHRAVALEPASSLCLVRLAFVLLLCEGRASEAIEIGRSAVFGNPSDSDARFCFGEVLAHTGNPEAAVEEFRMSLALNPFHRPTMRAALGRALLLAGRPDEAMAELRWCASRAPDYGPCHATMVVACAEAGHLEEARAARREIERVRPGWQPRNFDGPWFFHREADAERFLRAFRAVEG
jgi:TolB-like protein/Tfp pilus assembly protein PilF